MAAVTGIRTRILSHQRLSKGTFSATHRNASSWTEAALRKELTSRRLPLSYDYLTPLPSHLLTLSLSDFLPDIFQAPKILPSVQQPQHLPPGYHLIYFPPQVPPSQLLPDGTDLLHSPGAPFNRRLWAGGNVFFPTPKENLLLNGQRAVCVEKISDVNVRGAVGDEKVFVTIDRRFSTVQEGEDPEETRNRVLNSREVLTEQRTLAFLQDRKPEHTNSPNLAGKNSRLVKSPQDPEIRYTITPTKALLFRFSALTFNAHRIHLDEAYTREVEGHPGLLFHGPLSLTLLLRVLSSHLERIGRRIQRIEYRNIAPLFVEQELSICAKVKEPADSTWEAWIEGPHGGLSVRGTVWTEPLSA